jgi:hypothetical protein
LLVPATARIIRRNVIRFITELPDGQMNRAPVRSIARPGRINRSLHTLFALDVR